MDRMFSILIMWGPFGQRVARWFWFGQTFHPRFQSLKGGSPGLQFPLLVKDDLVQGVDVLLQMRETQFQFGDAVLEGGEVCHGKRLC